MISLERRFQVKNKFLQFLGLTKRAGKLLEGYNKCEDGIKYNKVKLIIISDEVSQNTKDKFANICERNDVYKIENINSEDLSNSIGVMKIGVIGVTDWKMSEQLIKLWKELIND